MGYIKMKMEREVESACTCGSGCILDSSEHSVDCKAQEILVRGYRVKPAEVKPTMVQDATLAIEYIPWEAT